MKFFVLIISIVLFSTVAMAYSASYTRTVPAKETTTVFVDLPDGKSVVEVEGTKLEHISCTFIDRGTGKVAFQATNTQRCVGTANLTLPAVMLAQVTNNENKTIELRIRVNDSK
jgi:hypothetical protein